jgi:hypothetical protein
MAEVFQEERIVRVVVDVRGEGRMKRRGSL